MRKITLSLESLAVESFHTTTPELPAGTVAAHEFTAPVDTCEPFTGQPETCGDTCGRTCWESCNGTCDSCYDTCGDSCLGGCFTPGCPTATCQCTNRCTAAC